MGWEERARRLLVLVEQLRSESDSPAERHALKQIAVKVRRDLLGEEG